MNSDKKSMRAMAINMYDVLRNNGMQIEEAIKKVLEQIAMFMPGTDIEYIENEIKGYVCVAITPEYMLLGSDSKDKIWWNKKKPNKKLFNWDRYQRYLIEEKGWAGSVVENMDESTDKILNALEDPENPTVCDSRGLVLGYVQSGKTAHYTALINKAIDAGYKLIIVLAGMHNSLRSQTQTRLDEEVLGYETSREQLKKNGVEYIENWIGVAQIETDLSELVYTLTTRDIKGDFSRKIANGIMIQPSKQPFVLIVKKNASVLKNILKYFGEDSPLAQPDPNNPGKKFVSAHVPLLIIDDEADQASINTNDIYDDHGELLDDYDPSKINGLIRKIYNTFEHKAYVGYTATPFANIFIHNETSTQEFGPDLFPKDFILSLPKPSNYVGPAEFFGIHDEPDMGLIRMIDYSENFAPLKHKSSYEPMAIPDSLDEAICSFLLSAAIRNYRGERTAHNSMLIHVTRFVEVQSRIYELVKDHFEGIKLCLRYNDQAIIEKFNSLYTCDYINTYKRLSETHPQHMKEAVMPEWGDVLAELKTVAEKIIIYKINGESKDALMYKDHKDTGLNVIAIGGDKLSRGLTLEGLTVSYYLRASKTYDTLMQMGRWFGYRPGYLDVCRLYTDAVLAEWFRHIAVATEELRDMLQYMSEIDATPEEFGLRVQKHPVMYITSQVKMRSGEERYLSYNRTLSETTVFELNVDFYNNNFKAADSFISLLGKPSEDFLAKQQRDDLKNSNHLFWENVNGHLISEFLAEYTTAKTAPRANSKALKEYIDIQMANGGLTDWTVCLINIGKVQDLVIGANKIGKGIERSGGDAIPNPSLKRCSIKRLMSVDHEYLDLNKEQLERVKEIKASKEKGGYDNANEFIRAEVRDKSKGFLLIYPIDTETTKSLKLEEDHMPPIGFAIVFPEAEVDTPIAYMVNNVFVEMEENV